MLKIWNWTAKRSGPHLTVTGEDEVGRPCKRTSVLAIEPLNGAVVAVQDGNLFTELLAGRGPEVSL